MERPSHGTGSKLQPPSVMAVGRTKTKLSLAATVFLVACILGCAKVAEVRLWNHTGSSIALSVGGRTFKVAPNGSSRFNMPVEADRIFVTINGTNFHFIYRPPIDAAYEETRSGDQIVNCRLEPDLSFYVAEPFVTNLNASLPKQPVGYPLKPQFGTTR